MLESFFNKVAGTAFFIEHFRWLLLPWAQGVHWTDIKRSEDVHTVFSTFNVSLVYVLRSGGPVNLWNHIILAKYTEQKNSKKSDQYFPGFFRISNSEGFWQKTILRVFQENIGGCFLDKVASFKILFFKKERNWMTAWKNAINDKDKKWWNKKIKNSINEWTMH